MNPEEIPVWKPLLKRIPLFHDLSGEDLGKVAALLKPLSLPRGATLFHQGDEADAFYVITSGRVNLVTERQGTKTIAGSLGRGDTLGELALLSGQPRPMTALLDTTTEFLVLSKKDFAAVLRSAPSILMQLSRTLSTQILRETSGRREAPRQKRILALVAALDEDDQSLFTLNFALALIEQTRRRVLFVDMDPGGGRFAKEFGLKRRTLTEAKLRQHNLRDSSLLKQCVQTHPSGLGIITLPPEVLAGRLFKSIFLLMNLLREHSDFVVLSMSGTLGEVEKSVLYEADQWILVGGAGREGEFSHYQRSLRRLSSEQKSLLEVWLGDKPPTALRLGQIGEWVRIPWPRSLAVAHRGGASAFSVLDRSARSRFGVESLARRIGGHRLGLALGTGAALGYALIGILKTFRREGIPIDVVSGTSIGSVIGGLYALGLSPEAIEEIAIGVDKAWVWENLFWDLTIPRSGLFEGTTLLRFIRSYFGDRVFSDLEIPFACVATDIENGEEVIFKEGKVAEAVRSSCGIPLIFQPFSYQGRFLVDGGLVEPVPTRVLSQLGADILVAVNLTVPAGARKTTLSKKRSEQTLAQRELEKLKKLTLPEAFQAPNLFQVFFQMIYTMEYEIARTRSSLSDVYIHPDLTGFSWTEMHRAKELIDAGEKVAEAVLPKVKALLPFFSDYCKVDVAKPVW
ncbi:MAG: patatin-like phospholipase family protein [Elusimicrobiota bacterium]